MPRRREVPIRPVIADSKYDSGLVTKFINVLMKDGKKSIAEKILYDAFDIIEKKIKKPPLDVFMKAVENVKPMVEVKSRRVGGSTYQVPSEVKTSRRTALAIRWLIGFGGSRSENSMARKMASELIDAYENKGTSIKKKEDTHKMAEANKAFAHFGW